MTKDKDHLKKAWIKNKDEIIKFLKQGKNVVFLTLGDPMIYSTYIYIFNLIKNEGFSIITIPGIPSFCDIAAKTEIPLVQGNEVLCIIPATVHKKKLKKLIQSSENIVLMKVSNNFNQILKYLNKSGHIENSVMISKSGDKEEQIFYNLKDKIFNKTKVNYLTTIIAKKNIFH